MNSFFGVVMLLGKSHGLTGQEVLASLDMDMPFTGTLADWVDLDTHFAAVAAQRKEDA